MNESKLKTAFLAFFAIATSSQHVYVHGLNGEEVCENHGYNQTECTSITCCQWGLNQCWSSIGRNECIDQSALNLTKCFAFIGATEDDHDDSLPIQFNFHDDYPRPRKCYSKDSNYFGFSGMIPNLYQDLSCCSNMGEYQLANSFSYYQDFYTGWISDPKGICVAFKHNLDQIVCSPDQGKYIVSSMNNKYNKNQNSQSLRLCKSTCEKLFETCGLPGDNFPEWLKYTDPITMCHELWNGVSSTRSNHQCDVNLACQAQLSLTVVDDNCLSIEEPSEQLVKYFRAMYEDFNGTLEDYPSQQCLTHSFDIKKILMIVGVVVGGLCSLCFMYIIFAYCCVAKRNNNISYGVQGGKNPGTHQPPETAGFHDELPRVSEYQMTYNSQKGTIVLAPTAPSMPIHNISNTGSTDSQSVIDSLPNASLELTFLQTLDLRDLDYQKEMGRITEETYQEKRKRIIYGYI